MEQNNSNGNQISISNNKPSNPIWSLQLSDNNGDSQKESVVEFLNSMPPGFRFHPTDLELIVHYLQKKNKNEKLPHNCIYVVEFNKYNPDTLAGDYKDINGEKVWYFFTQRDRKERGSKRPDRTAENGYWRASKGKTNINDVNGVPVGDRKLMVYCKWENGKGIQTDWRVHEFTETKPPARAAVQTDDTMRLDGWVICKLFETPRKASKSNTEDEIQNPPADDTIEESGPPAKVSYSESELDTDCCLDTLLDSFLRDPSADQSLTTQFTQGSTSYNPVEKYAGLGTDEEREFDDDIRDFQDRHGHKQ